MKRKIPVYKKRGNTYVKIKEITEEEAKIYVDDPDVEEIEAIYITEEENETEGEERKIHEYP